MPTCSVEMICILLSLCLQISQTGKVLVWSDEFDYLDVNKWTHDVTSYPQVGLGITQVV